MKRSEPFSAAMALYLSVLALFALTVAELPDSMRASSLLALAITGFVSFWLMLSYTSAMEERRKQSIVWLHALEKDA